MASTGLVGGDRILVDRFLVTADRCAIDLVSGAPVVVKIGVGGGAAEQARWAARCDWFHRVRQPAIATLVDYGGLGESHRFEAWPCGDPARGVSTRSAQTLKAAARFLAACGLTTGSLTEAGVYRNGDSAVVLPAAETGYIIEPETDDGAPRVGAWPLDECGICAIDRRVDAAIAELFSAFSGARPHLISITGPPGSGRTTVVCRAARIARTRGFVPISGAMLERVDHRLFKGRQLCVILDHDSGSRWQGLLSSVLASPRPHAVLQIHRDHTRRGTGSDGHEVILDRIPAAALVAAIRPACLDGSVVARVRRAAEASHGLPGRFAALLWQRRTGAQPSRRFIVAAPAVLRVAERSAVYGTDAGTPAPVRSGSQSSEPGEGWPAPGELAAFRRRAELARVLLRKGRHAPAVRQLRQIFSALNRRHDWVQAGEVGLMLASALLRRGDAEGALGIVEQARSAIERTGSDTALIDAAVISGHGWIDLARLDEAESVVATAVAVARRIGDSSRTLSASAALGRCLFWKGQYADAVSTLAPVCNGNVPDLAVAAMIDSARAEVGQGNLPNAISFAREATERASSQAECCSDCKSRVCDRLRASGGRRPRCHRAGRAPVHRLVEGRARSDGRDAGAPAARRRRPTARPRRPHGLQAASSGSPGCGSRR